MASQRFQFSPSIYLPLVLLVLFGLGVFLFGQQNLSSLQHLWRTFDHPLGQTLFPSIQDQQPSASYLSGRIWQAEQVLSDGDPAQAAQIIAGDVQAGTVRAVRLQGKIFETQGSLEPAINTWRSINDALSLIQAGEKLDAEEDLTGAMQAFEAAYEVDPDDGTYRISRFLRVKLEDTSRAEEILTTSIATYTRSSNRPLWLRELGILYKSQERWGDAELAFKAAIDIEPRDVSTFIQLGRLQYDADGDVDEAVEYFEQVIALDDRRGYGQIEIANMLRREKRYAEAVPWFEAAIEREPDRGSLYYLRGLSTVQGGDRVTGLQLLQQTTEQFPDYAAPFYQLSVLYFQDDLLSEAQTAIEQAIELSGSNVPAYMVRQAEAIEKAASQ